MRTLAIHEEFTICNHGGNALLIKAENGKPTFTKSFVLNVLSQEIYNFITKQIECSADAIFKHIAGLCDAEGSQLKTDIEDCLDDFIKNGVIREK